MKAFFIFFLGLFAIGTISLTSCKKPLLLSTGNLSFSADTVVFDTVFTTIGSTTKQLKIYNNQNRTVKIEEVQLMGGTNSPFRINLDGLSGVNFADIDLEGKDSLFAFVEVTLDPNGQNLPMVVEDSIRFRTNGKDQYVLLAAWGQDVYYHYSDLSGPNPVFDLNEGIWPNDKPHLIYGAAFIDEDKALIIQEGTQIYLHKNAALYVYKGTLNINGTLGNEVTFQGDRLEQDYADVSGQYFGIYLDSAKSSTINYAIIKNGTTGIHIEGDHPTNGTLNTVTVTNTTIENCARYGILNFFGGKIKAENSLIYKNGFNSYINIAGGGFDFNHCNLLGYSNGEEQFPSVAISDNYTAPGQFTYTTTVSGTIRNSVIYGNQDIEIFFDTITNGHQFTIENCLIKSTPEGTSPLFGSGNVWNSDPQFIDKDLNNFKFFSTSSLQGGANPAFPTSNGNLDLLGNSRSVTSPDIGVYDL